MKAEAALASVAAAGKAGGWWVQRYPVAEVDHVWRLLINAHIHSKSLGSVVHVAAASFSKESAGEAEVRVMVRDASEMVELRRLGAALLSIAPSSHASDRICARLPLTSVPARAPPCSPCAALSALCRPSRGLTLS